MGNERKHRVLVTFELPSFYAEDMTREALADWMEATGDTYEEALVEALAIDSTVLIVLEALGDKDSSVVVTPGLLTRVELQNERPSDEPDLGHYWKLTHEGWPQLRSMDEADDDAEAPR